MDLQAEVTVILTHEEAQHLALFISTYLQNLTVGQILTDTAQDVIGVLASGAYKISLASEVSSLVRDAEDYLGGAE